MSFWRENKKLWSEAWHRSPLRVVICVTCMVALLVTVLVVFDEDSDAAGVVGTPDSRPTGARTTAAAVTTDEHWSRDGIWNVENPFLKLPPPPMWEVKQPYKRFMQGRFGNSRNMEFPNRIKRMIRRQVAKSKNPGGNRRCARGRLTRCWWANPWPAHSCSVAIVDCNRPADHAIPWRKIKRVSFICGATGAGGAFIALKAAKPTTPHTFVVAAGAGFLSDAFPCALGFAAGGWD